MTDIFDRAKDIALNHIQDWLPGGTVENGQWVVKNPTRNDHEAGSFKINLFTGAWNDYADSDAVGHDAISLYAYLNGTTNYDAAKEILSKYDPDYFPTPGDIRRGSTWYQLERSHRDAPSLEEQPNEIARWPLEAKIGQVWRVVMWIVRFKDEFGKKSDIPFTLFTDSKHFQWRRSALKNTKYPLYGLRNLIEHPNLRVILYEGQKCAAVVQPIIGDEWVCVGWYGGAGNPHLTDMDPLIGREVWYPFDADNAGRQAIKRIIDDLHIQAHLVYPPAGVPKGWDHADAVQDSNWGKNELEYALLNNPPQPTQLEPFVGLTPENRPTRLDIPVSVDFREYIYTNVYQWENEILHIMDGWFFWVVEQDAALRNCIKYDYTTGTKTTAYESSEIFDANLEYRLKNLGMKANLVTKYSKERICGEVIRLNSSFNRVADYMDMLVNRYPNENESIIDEFMKIFIFNIPKRHDEDEEVYADRCDKVEKLYRELFHKFFTRMHCRIKGTRKDDTGNYFGLIENDIVPILEGPQDIGKTSLCRWLACDDELYIDLGSGLKQGFGSAETVKKIRGRLIAEIGEMKIMKNAEAVETIKSFISMKAATVDIKYVENQKDIPMTASFIGTSNPAQYLSDDTGNRRFWPVKLKDIDLKFTSEHNDLPLRLHAYYTKMTSTIGKNDIYAACTPSDELKAMMDELREAALITYSDYELCLKMIREWKLNNIMGGMIDQADIELKANEKKYPIRITQRGFNRAAKDAGFIRVEKWDDIIGHMVNQWQWEPKIKGGEDVEPPF